MKKNIRTKLVILSILILSVVGSVGYADYKSNQKLLESLKWVQHTEEVINLSERIFSLTKDMEMRVQGPLILNDTNLVQAGAAPDSILASLRLLKRLTTDNPGQQKRTDSLSFYIHAYISYFFQPNGLRIKRGKSSSMVFGSTNQAIRPSDRINQFTSEIQLEEKGLLQRRMAISERNIATSKIYSYLMSWALTSLAILLLIAGSKYFMQAKERGRRAAELIIANEELLFQNKEKSNRAAELAIANEELLFQNEEKEKRAAELIIANEELLFQNKEKGDRAAELVIANEELVFQNQVKESVAQERLQSEKRLARAQELAHMGSWELSLATNIVLYSDESCRIHGIPIEQNRMSFESWLSFVHPDDMDMVLMKTKAPRDSMENFSFYYRIIDANHIVRHIYIESRLQFDLNLKPTGLYGVIQDVTEIRLAEEKANFDRNNLAALINNTEDMMWSIDSEFRLITSNEAFDKFIMSVNSTPLAKGEKVLLQHVEKGPYHAYKELYERALSGESFTVLCYFDHPDEQWCEVSFHPLLDGGITIGTACFSRDVTQRTKSENALREMEEQVLTQKVQEQKKITRAILNAQEKERNHIGQELHDNISQILASSKLYLSSAVRDNEAMKDLVKYPIALIDSSIQEIRLLSSKHVTPIRNVDLRELVQSLLNELQNSSSINTEFSYQVENIELTDDLKLNIYRIIQEQVNNIVKHACPAKVGISVQAESQELHIEMKDDGKGFDVKKKRKGVGISNMMNRIDSFNGKMAIESSPGKGCTIQIAIPY